MSVAHANTDEELEAFLSASQNRLVIAKFGAEWCKPCQKLQPFVDALAAELDEDQRDAIVVCVEKTEETEETFLKYNVTKLPTVVLFVNKEVKTALPRPDPAELRTHVFSLMPLPHLRLDEDF